MRLRNWKETTEPTLEEELRAVISNLDVPWTWHVEVCMIVSLHRC